MAGKNSFDLDKLPSSPGVYIFKDNQNRILYVGKAHNLQKRVRSYFHIKNHSPKVEVLVSRIKEIDFFCTHNEKEALLLEASLIKKHKPKFNVVLRDDKNYLLFKLDKKQEYPAIYLTRKVEKDGCAYFGPFVSARSARETLKAINRIFPIRKCKDSVFRNRIRPCLQYYLNRCLAPCVFEVAKEVYNKIVKDLELFLSGKSKNLLDRLKKEMWDASSKMEFEKAAILRDQIKAIQVTLEKQAVVDPEEKNKDIINMAKEKDTIFLCVLFVRQGKLLDHKTFKIPDPDTLDDEEILKEFLFQFYSPSKFIPEEVIVPITLDDPILEDVLTEWKGERVRIKKASSWKEKDLLGLALKNIHTEKHGLESIDLGFFMPVFNKIPKRIEAVDVSHIGGAGVVVGVVVFEDGHLKKDDYRIYKMQSLNYTWDDYRALKEWVKRRIKSGPPWPDLLVVDGGRGQLKVVAEELAKFNLNWNILAIAKPREDEKEDKIYILDNDKYKRVKDFKGLKFIQFLRDSVHRFVLSRQRRLRKKDLKSELENLKGIGPKTAKLLWTRFKSLDKILNADVKQLTEIPGIGEKKAKLIYGSLKELKETLSRKKNGH